VVGRVAQEKGGETKNQKTKMDAVNEASTVADDGLSVASITPSEVDLPLQEEEALVSFLVSSSLKIALPITSEASCKCSEFQNFATCIQESIEMP